jgi:hypothetical protein
VASLVGFLPDIRLPTECRGNQGDRFSHHAASALLLDADSRATIASQAGLAGPGASEGGICSIRVRPRLSRLLKGNAGAEGRLLIGWMIGRR